MDYIALYNYALIILLLPLIALAFFALKYARNGWSRLTMVALFLITVLVSFVVPNEFTSYPKPVSQEWYERELKEAEVLWSHIDPDAEEMHMLLSWKGQPRLYQPAWDWNLAKELSQAMMESEQAKEEGGSGEITMNYPFLSQEEREARIAADRAGQSEVELDKLGQSGAEQEDDSDTFHVRPPEAMPEKEPSLPRLET